MYPETWKFHTLVYSLVILWCCMIRAKGDTDTNVDSSMVTETYSNSELLKILLGIQNGRTAQPSNSIVSMDMNARSINFNVPFIFFGLNSEEIKRETHKTPINKLRDDYTLTEGIGYHKLHKTKLNWNDARKACMAENAHLVVINSAEEAEALRQLMKDQAGSELQAYIGAHDLYEEGDWVTISGESLKRRYNVWASDESYSYPAEEEDCAVLDKNRGINDEPCHLEYYYICEIPLRVEEQL